MKFTQTHPDRYIFLIVVYMSKAKDSHSLKLWYEMYCYLFGRALLVFCLGEARPAGRYAP